jgi:hypothetical protein
MPPRCQPLRQNLLQNQRAGDGANEMLQNQRAGDGANEVLGANDPYDDRNAKFDLNQNQDAPLEDFHQDVPL